MMESAVLEFWRGYLDTLLPDLDQPKSAGVFSFGDSKKLADELAALVRQGIKTATCSALMSYKKLKHFLFLRKPFSTSVKTSKCAFWLSP
jgi:hypothetical protein